MAAGQNRGTTMKKRRMIEIVQRHYNEAAEAYRELTGRRHDRWRGLTQVEYKPEVDQATRLDTLVAYGSATSLSGLLAELEGEEWRLPASVTIPLA
jgi:hypothetical protein